MVTLTDCPVCKTGDLYPHCERSSACDLVECDRCHAKGSLDGRWWPGNAGLFAAIADAADELRSDLDDDEGRDL